MPEIFLSAWKACCCSFILRGRRQGTLGGSWANGRQPRRRQQRDAARRGKVANRSGAEQRTCLARRRQRRKAEAAWSDHRHDRLRTLRRRGKSGDHGVAQFGRRGREEEAMLRGAGALSEICFFSGLSPLWLAWGACKLGLGRLSGVCGLKKNSRVLAGARAGAAGVRDVCGPWFVFNIEG